MKKNDIMRNAVPGGQFTFSGPSATVQRIGRDTMQLAEPQHPKALAEVIISTDTGVGRHFFSAFHMSRRIAHVHL